MPTTTFYFEANCGGCGRHCDVTRKSEEGLPPRLRCCAPKNHRYYNKDGKIVTPPSGQEVRPDDTCFAWIPDGPVTRRP